MKENGSKGCQENGKGPKALRRLWPPDPRQDFSLCPRTARAQPLLHARIAPALSCSALPSYAARALIHPSPPEPEIHLARFDAKKTRQLEGGGGVWGGLSETLHGSTGAHVHREAD